MSNHFSAAMLKFPGDDARLAPIEHPQRMKWLCG